MKKLDEIVRFPKLAQMIGVSRSTIFRWEKAGIFPRHIRLGPNCTGWLLKHVEEWFSARQAIKKGE